MKEDIFLKFNHTLVPAKRMPEMNNADADDGNRWVCNACLLPIFSTPFVGDGDDPNSLVMHTQCADQLPAIIEGHPFHLMGGDLCLFVEDSNSNSENYCDRCNSICGSKFYACTDCGLKLDLTCALQIKITHRSHAHVLTATRGRSSSFVCNACGIQHQPPLRLQKHQVKSAWDLFYVCSTCDFWIHPDCALLPNAIVVDNKYHSHPLLLSYSHQNISLRLILAGIRTLPPHTQYIPTAVCAICDGKSESIGWYECLPCGYSAHVKCVSHSDPAPQPVLLRDAKLPGLLHLPLPDEHQNLMASIMKTYQDTTSTSTTTNGDGASSSTTRVDGDQENNKVHEHPLIFHDHPHDDVALVCNVCVRPVSLLDPFYSCNELSCRDFILHDCCAHIPSTLPFNQTLLNLHEIGPETCGDQPLSLVSQSLGCDFFTISMLRQTNGFVYSCNRCDLALDVVAALMPPAITHGVHSKSHSLRKTVIYGATCNFCNMPIYNGSEIAYECNNGCYFYVHAECAILPGKVSHEFDPHPLKLLAYNPEEEEEKEKEKEKEEEEKQEDEEIPFCEICENKIGKKGCRYSCSTCNQIFHADCFPKFDELSKIKFGFTVRVRCHDCPLACVRAHPLVGYKCDHCKVAIREESNKIAFECAKCYFRMHMKCVKELLSES